MGVISKVEANFHDIQYIKVIKCDSSGRFSMELPEPIMVALGREKNHDTLYGNTLHEIDSQLSVLRREYEGQQKSYRDVIILKFEKDFHFGQGIMIGISARSYIEETTKQTKGNSTIVYKGFENAREELSLDLRNKTETRLWERDIRNMTVLPLTREYITFLNNISTKSLALKDALSNLGSVEGVTALMRNPQLLIEG